MILLSLATRRLQPAIQAQKRDLEIASKFATSSIKAIDIVKIFNGYDRELRQYSEAIKFASKQYLIQAQCNCFQMGYVAFWVVGIFVAGFWYGSILVDHGLSPGQIITTFFSVLSAFQGIEALLPQWLVLSKGMFAGAFLSSLSPTCEDGAAEKNGGQIKPDSCIGNVDMIDVCLTESCFRLFMRANQTVCGRLPLRILQIPKRPSSISHLSFFPPANSLSLWEEAGQGKVQLGISLLNSMTPRRA
jgi:ATP-binding cassette subfamily B (MDR/TAP) protein 1